jgi:hypothetical protein
LWWIILLVPKPLWIYIQFRAGNCLDVGGHSFVAEASHMVAAVVGGVVEERLNTLVE